MKYLLGILFVFSNLLSYAQCPVGNVHLKTQAEVNAFKILYPNCTQINGDLFIGDDIRNDIRDLSGISKITHIDNSFIMQNCIALIDLNSLSALNYIGKDVRIKNLTRLIDIPFLYNMDHIQGDVIFYELPALKNLDFLSNLIEIKGDLDISRCSGEINQNYKISRIGGGLNFDYIYSLSTLNAFESLREAKYINLSNCPLLTDITGLRNTNPDSIDALVIQYNLKLTDCNIEAFCEVLQVPSGAFVQISNNGYNCNENAILRFCNNVQEICPSDNVYINGQTDLEKFKVAYPECESMENFIYINSSQEDEIIDLTPLFKLKKSKGINIANTKKLFDLTGLFHLNEVEYLTITNNEKLLSLNGLQNIKKLKYLKLEANNSLIDISNINFDSIKNINDIILTNNYNLQDINSLSKIDSIKERLYIGDTDVITDLGQLDGIKFINALTIRRINNLEKINDFFNDISIQYLNLGFCPKLNEIEFNDKIKIEKEINISYNPNLEKCYFLNLPDSIETISLVNNVNIKNIELGGILRNLGMLSFYGCDKLQNFSIPNVLKNIERFIVHYNQNLSSLIGGDSLNKIGQLYIASNYLLSDISGLDHDITIDNLNISNNTSLSNCAIQPLCQLPNLDQVTIENNNGSCNSLVSSLSHCPNLLRNPKGDVTISDVNSLEKFKADYPNADSIYGNLIFLNLTDVESIDLSYFSQIKYLDSALILDNCMLDNIQSLKDIEFTSLEIKSCPKLKSLPLFSKLNIADFVNIEYCESLKSIEGLSLLTTASDVNLKYLDSLRNLKGLENLRYVDNITFRYLPITYADSLNKLEKVNYNFRMEDCNELIHLNNLTKLKSIGTLELRSNKKLKSLFPLNGLDSIRDGITIYFCENLDSITGLEKVKEIHRNIDIRYNAKLYYMSFDSLLSTEHIFIYRNNLLLELNFPKLRRASTFTLSANSSLQNLGTLNNLEKIEGDLRIEGNISLTNIEGINPNVDFGELILTNNSQLRTCHVPIICNALYRGQKISLWDNGLGCMIEAEVEEKCGFVPKECPSSDVWLTNNDIVNLYNQYYSNCSVINGDLNLRNNISTQPTLDNIEIIVSNLVIRNLNGLPNLKFVNLIEIGRQLEINYTRDLNNCEFPKLGNHTYFSLYIRENQNLKETPKFENLSISSGHIYISNNDDLINIDGFNKIDKPTYIEIQDNPKLISITGMRGLNTINPGNTSNISNQLLIKNNKVLNTISGLSYPFYLQNLVIQNNPNLSQCAIEGVCLHLLANRKAIISNNGQNCESPDEVKEACLFVSTDEENSVPGIRVYPNPTSGILQIDNDKSLNRVVLVSTSGVQWDLKPGSFIDLSAFPNGIYFLKLYGAEQNITYKVVKI